MKQIILLIFIIFSYTNAYEFKLNKKDISYIKNSPDKTFIVNRLKKYQYLKKKIVNYELYRKLSHMNVFLNKIRSKLDVPSKGLGDHWATPKEFLIGGHGDCEDYVIAKYFSLLELGIKKEKLYFSVVDIKGQSQAHMVLLYLEDKTKTPLVLDNLSSKVVSLKIRKKLQPRFAFNEIDSYKLTNKGFTQKVNINWGKEDKWNRLLKRVYEKNE